MSTSSPPGSQRLAFCPSAHPFAHPAPPKLLITVFIALVLLTILTLAMSSIDLGLMGAFGFWIAMSIASFKAALVLLFFMHMYWDKPFNVLVFLSSSLFVILFIGLPLMDSSHYKNAVDEYPRQPDPPALSP